MGRFSPRLALAQEQQPAPVVPKSGLAYLVTSKLAARLLTWPLIDCPTRWPFPFPPLILFSTRPASMVPSPIVRSPLSSLAVRTDSVKDAIVAASPPENTSPMHETCGDALKRHGQPTPRDVRQGPEEAPRRLITNQSPTPEPLGVLGKPPATQSTSQSCNKLCRLLLLAVWHPVG